MTVEELKKYKEGCYSALSRDLSEFEKNFLYIAVGLLAFSITFLKDFVQPEKSSLKIALFFSWGFIIIAIALMMYSFLKSVNANNLLLNTIERFETNNKLFNKDQELTEGQTVEIRKEIKSILDTSKSGLKKLRNTAVASFILGIISLSFFVAWNMAHDKTYSFSNTITVDKGTDKVIIKEN